MVGSCLRGILTQPARRGKRCVTQAYPPFFYAHPPRTADARGFPPFFALWRYNASIICP